MYYEVRYRLIGEVGNAMRYAGSDASIIRAQHVCNWFFKLTDVQEVHLVSYSPHIGYHVMKQWLKEQH